MTRSVDHAARGGVFRSFRRNSVKAGDPQGVRGGDGSREKLSEDSGLYSLSPRALWGVLKRQPASFWLVCTYLFFEYVRPQELYERIQGPPYARVVIILALVSFLFERGTFRFRLPELWLTIFSVVILMSSVMAFQPSDSYDKLSVYFSWVLIYLLIANAVDTEERFLVFMLSFLLYSFKMSQHGTRSWAEDGFIYRKWGTTGAPGWFHNSGEFGIQMCIFLPLIVAFIMGLGEHWPRWLRWAAWGIAGTAVTGIVGSSSRGAIVGLGAVSLWALVRTRKKIRTLFAVILLAGVVYAIVPPESKLRFQQAGDDPTSIARTTMWKQGLQMMEDYPVFGIGYANWLTYRGIYHGDSRTLAHNVFIEAGSELGFTGLAVFLTLIGCTFVINRRTRKVAEPEGSRGRFIFFMALGLDGALVGLIASGFFISVLYYPFFWINFAMTVALHNAALNALSGTSAPAAARRASRDRSGIRGVVPVIS